MQINPINNSLIKKSPSFGSMGSVANKIAGSKIVRGMEFNGIDMAFPILMIVMMLGVFGPRVKNAQDKYDREEIIRRDVTTIGTLGVGSKILTKLFTRVNEAKSGFALAAKPENFAQSNGLKKALQYFRPVNGVKALNSAQLISKYSDIAGENGYKEGLNGLVKFIDNQGGNLKKFFSLKNGGTKEIVEQLVGGTEKFAQADNKTIMNAIKNAGSDITDKLVNIFKKPDNAFVKKAKAMNSTFGFLSTIVLVPLLLGVGLPKLNEKITKNKIAARNKENQPSEQPTAKV